VQVEKSSYVWLPLLPRLDGQGYELVYADKWSPSDYKERARIPVVYNNGTEPEGISIDNVPMNEGATGGGSVEPEGAAAEVWSALFCFLVVPAFAIIFAGAGSCSLCLQEVLVMIYSGQTRVFCSELTLQQTCFLERAKSKPWIFANAEPCV
jgi:hypothetical protein